MSAPVAVLYEHPEWFRPLFAALDRRGLPYVRLRAEEHHFDPSATSVPFSLLVNRMSASSYTRGHANAIFHAQQYLEYVESLGVPVLNGSRAYALDLSKARQLWLMTGLGLPHPRSRVANSVAGVLAAASELRFPLIVKPSLGGSGALMRRFEDADALRAAADAGLVAPILGVDHTAIVQEFHPSRGGSIVRVEVLEDRFLYAIRITKEGQDDFNLCPADICQAPDGGAAASVGAAAPTGGRPGAGTGPAEPPKRAMTIEAVEPPAWIVDGVRAIFRVASVDVGGVEYLESERDGGVYFYDVNTLSNFVSDAPALLGFDPYDRLADAIARRAGAARREAAGAAR